MRVVWILSVICLVLATGCSLLDEGCSATYGLTNPQYSAVAPNPGDESIAGGDLDQQSVEQFDKKYHERNIFKTPQPELIEEDSDQPQMQPR
jgi:hypothetical protein